MLEGKQLFFFFAPVWSIRLTVKYGKYLFHFFSSRIAVWTESWFFFFFTFYFLVASNCSSSAVYGWACLKAQDISMHAGQQHTPFRQWRGAWFREPAVGWSCSSMECFYLLTLPTGFTRAFPTEHATAIVLLTLASMRKWFTPYVINLWKYIRTIRKYIGKTWQKNPHTQLTHTMGFWNTKHRHIRGCEITKSERHWDKLVPKTYTYILIIRPLNHSLFAWIFFILLLLFANFRIQT